MQHGPEGESIAAELPNGLSLRDLGHAVVDVLERRGLVDVAFFDRLQTEFPGRATEIRAVCAEWIAARPAGEECPPISIENPEVRELCEKLENAYRQREDCIVSGTASDAADLDILELRRAIRQGPQLHPGECLNRGRYRLITILGSGGFATVWKAYDRETRQVVAVKILHGQWSRDQSHRERFCRGARTMGKIRHLHIVRTLREPCDENGYLYYVMEMIEGTNLHRAVLDGSIDVRSAALLLLAICDALGEAHSLGIIHRDIKPSNILLDKRGKPYLTDFDLSYVESTTGGTRTGAGIGTLFFSAPETLVDAARVDVRADVYSVGMVLLFATLGRELHFDDLDALRAGQLPLPSKVGAVIVRATTRNVERRYASIEELINDLRSRLAHAENASKTAPRPATAASDMDASTNQIPTARPSNDTAREPQQQYAASALVLVCGHEKAIRYLLDSRDVTIGRGRANEIPIREEAVSRIHARLRCESGVWKIRDKGSTNGTYVNDAKVVEAWLKDGDRIKIGRTIFVFLQGSDLETSYDKLCSYLHDFDALTRVHNKRYFIEALPRHISTAKRLEEPLSVLLFCVDGFKRHNDAFGIHAGDVLLCELAETVKKGVRKMDVFARYGENQFALLLLCVDVSGTGRFATQLRELVSDTKFQFEGRTIPLTISCGFATMLASDTTGEGILGRAEVRMLTAEQNGGDRIIGEE